jgi:nucleotide-binding universal stress UspA family protein
MYRKILVPIDGSETSIYALDHAIRLAQHCKENDNTASRNLEVIILYVIPEMPISRGLGLEGPMRSPKTGELIPFSEYVKEIYALIKSNSEKKFTELKNKYESFGIPIQTKVIADAKGSIVDNILKYAKDEKVDLIELEI